MSRPGPDGFVHAFGDLLADEEVLLRERRMRRGVDADGPRSGLALSGGGIRAAAFGLGVIRALHARGRFHGLDYLSTVSGGGFVGAFVGWVRRLAGQVADSGHDVLPQSALQFIREHANYLEPGGAAANPDRAAPTGLILIAFTLGRTLLSLGVYGALLIGLFYVLHVGDALVDLLKPLLLNLTRFHGWNRWVGVLDFATVAALVVLGLAGLRQIGSVLGDFLAKIRRAAVPQRGEPTPRSAWRGALWLLLGLVSGALGMLAVATVASGQTGRVPATIAAILLGALVTWALRNCRAEWQAPARDADLRGAWLLLPVLAAVLVAVAVTAGLLLFLALSSGKPVGLPAAPSPAHIMIVGVLAATWLLWLVPRAVRGALRIVRALRNPRDPQAEYLRSLRFQRRSGVLLTWTAAWLVLASVPWSARLLHALSDSRVLHLYVLAAMILALAFWLASRAAVPSGGGRRAPAAGLRPWMFRGACAALLYGFLLLMHGLTAGILDTRVPEAALWIPGLGLLLGWLAELNSDGPGQIYRNRLAEAFLPDPRAIRENRWYPAVLAAQHRLSESRAPEDPGPYHLLNASVATTGSPHARLRQRGADNFVLSAMYCGSDATGWADTTRWLQGRLTLRDAVGISAGAVEPGAGFYGRGGARDPLVGATLALLNLQLGYWADNPNPTCCPRTARLRPNLIRPGLLHGMFGAGGAETDRTVCLSDGSGFENLGLYELLRRRLDLIVVADSSADPDYGFAALAMALERARQDLDTDVVFEPGALFPRTDRSEEPASARTRGFAIGQIRYSRSRTGVLLYVKPALIDGLDATVRSFAAGRPDFPQESTEDQDFDEYHFVAYERLGYQIAQAALDSLAHREASMVERGRATAGTPGDPAPV